MTFAPGDSPWLQTLIRSLDSTQISPLGETLPRFPSTQMQENTTSLSAEAALRHAYAFYDDVDRETRAIGREINAETRVLDFGFGWGRISRTFMEKASIRNLYGVDVDPAFASMTRELIGSDQFDPGRAVVILQDRGCDRFLVHV